MQTGITASSQGEKGRKTAGWKTKRRIPGGDLPGKGKKPSAHRVSQKKEIQSTLELGVEEGTVKKSLCCQLRVKGKEAENSGRAPRGVHPMSKPKAWGVESIPLLTKKGKNKPTGEENREG